MKKAKQKDLLKLELKATEFRRDILEMIVKARGTHIASAFSIVDILVYLYDKVLHIDPKKPSDPKRDKFILSKGHGCAALYMALADKGFFPKSVLETYCLEGSILGGHPDSSRVPGVEASTGSLGHGLPVSVGFALADKMNKSSAHVYCLVGDGELNEGSNWEAIMVAAHHKLDNLTLILDDNKLMISGFAKDILNPFSFKEKFLAFGWNAIEIDGHNFSNIYNAFSKIPAKNSKPTVIIANTIKGKGISYMENEKEWYSRLPDEKLMEQARFELHNKITSIKKRLAK